jgi:hypothetical protein
MITAEDIRLLCNVAKEIGVSIDPKSITLQHWAKGVETHRPARLPKGLFAVYIFVYQNIVLKVGKVSGTKNNDRYYQHHYLVKGASSTLAKSIMQDADYSHLVKDGNVREWIVNNTERYNIQIPKELGANFIHFVEAFFIIRFNPKYEGRVNKL